MRSVVYIACCLLVALCLPVRGALAQADTVLSASFGDEPGQALTAHSYVNPQGVRVHQYRINLTPRQASTLALMLHTGSHADSLDARIIAVSGRHELAERSRSLTSKDLLLLGADATEPIDCGTAEPCRPNRLVVDLRLRAAPHKHLWVCQIVLEGE